MKKIIFTIFCMAFTIVAYSQAYRLESPDKKIQVAISVDKSINYTVATDGKSIINNSEIGLKTSLEKNIQWKVSKTSKSAINETLNPVVWQKSSTVVNHYNQLAIDFKNGLSLEWRAFDNGVAWRWLSKHQGSYVVENETATFRFDANGRSWYPQEEEFFSGNERLYKPYKIGDIDASKLASLPALFESQGIKVLLTESDLWNYAGMWVRGESNGGIKAVFPDYPKTKQYTGDRDEIVTARENFIAKINGSQSFPWRVLMIARTDNELLVNQLPYLLGRPATGDYSWVRPGKVIWDWWNDNNVTGVDFRAGVNTETYKYYIDFAAKYGIEYVLLDEGWCDTQDLFKISAGMNMDELAAYAKAKNVSLLLWTSWRVLDQQLDRALDQFAKWGVKGIKVDFMQRDDQDMVNYYQKVAVAAAKRKMLVDFHGAYKPSGWLRTFPNMITSEGVYGLEQSKWNPATDEIAPPHNVTLPFIRMAAGPMDFTPGAMRNAQKDNYKPVWGDPVVLGTRCHQLGMYVVYESPVQMLCDNPSVYAKEPECMEFLKVVPTVWKQTIPLQSKVGEYVSVARQSANGDWYIGAMTDWSSRDLNVNLSFLGDGNYKMQVWKDGANADRNAKDFKMETVSVNKNTPLVIKMATGGGFVARIYK